MHDEIFTFTANSYSYPACQDFTVITPALLPLSLDIVFSGTHDLLNLLQHMLRSLCVRG